MTRFPSRLTFLAPILISCNAWATVAPAPVSFSVPALDSWGLQGLTVLAGLAGIIAIRMKRK